MKSLHIIKLLIIDEHQLDNGFYAQISGTRRPLLQEKLT